MSKGCETCGSYELKKMINTGKPYGYAGEILCLTCVRYSTMEDRHTTAQQAFVEQIIEKERNA